MNNNEGTNNNSFDIIDLSNIDNINPKIFQLFKNFLIKENKSIFNKDNSPTKEIMPEYLDIDSEIQKKINDVRMFYASDPYFKEMLSGNSYVMTLFKKGFKDIFFGPKGIVTRKSVELKKYYKNFESKLDLNSKIYAGSLDYYDFLSNYNSYFERLKYSRKKILKISGNFSVSNTHSEKMHAAYLEYEKKRKKKIELLKKKNKKNNLNSIINTSINNTIYNEDNSVIKSKTKNNFYSNTYTKDRKNIFSLGKINECNKKLKTKNIFLNYKKNSEDIINNKMKNKINHNNMNFTPSKISSQPIKNNLVNILSLPTEENDKDKNEVRKSEKQLTEIYPIIREDKRHLTNISTISNKNKKIDSLNISRAQLHTSLIRKMPIKKKNTFVVLRPHKLENRNDNKTKLKLDLSSLMKKSKIIDKTCTKKIQIENYTSNKSLKVRKISDTSTIKESNKPGESIEAIRLSLKNQIDSTMPSNKRVENSLNKFINNNKKYELKKKDLLQRRMKEELIELKEDMKNVGNYNEFVKKVDFSDIRHFSPRNNHKVKKRIKGSSFNIAFSFRTRLEKNLPIKEFIQSLEKMKEKEKEKKFLKIIRKNFKKNIKHIHNLTVSLENIKKKYKY